MSLRRELLDEHAPFGSVELAQAAIDEFRLGYNTCRPHQSLDMAYPADRFQPNPNDGISLKLPPSLIIDDPAPTPPPRPAPVAITPAAPVTTSVGFAVQV